MGGEDTDVKRRELARSMATEMKNYLIVPPSCEGQLHEGFDPVLGSGDIID